MSGTKMEIFLHSNTHKIKLYPNQPTKIYDVESDASGTHPCLGAPNKLDAASTVYGKIYFYPDLLEPMIRHLSTRPRFGRKTSPNQTRKDKRRIKTIFNHFRDKPAR